MATRQSNCFWKILARRTSIQNHCSKEILYERNTTPTNNSNVATITVDPVLHFPPPPLQHPQRGVAEPLVFKGTLTITVSNAAILLCKGRWQCPRSSSLATFKDYELNQPLLEFTVKLTICPVANLLLEIICLPDNSKVCFRSHQTPEGEWSEFSFFYYLISSVSQVQNWPESCCVNI